MSDKEQMDQRIIEQQVVVENEDNNIQSNTEDNLVGNALSEVVVNRIRCGECGGESHETVESENEFDCGCRCNGYRCDCECVLSEFSKDDGEKFAFNTDYACNCADVFSRECGCECDCYKLKTDFIDPKKGDESDKQINLLKTDSRKSDDRNLKLKYRI